MRNLSARSICFIALFTAVTAVLSIISIPTPIGVPITLQTFAIALSGFVLGKKYGTCSTILYVLLGMIGIPVYAGMQAGMGVLFGATGGYLFGFILMAFFCGVGMEQKKRISLILFSILGLACCHIPGIIQLKFVLNLSWPAAAFTGSVPYLLKDALSVMGAYLAAIAIRRTLIAAHIMDWERTSQKGKANCT